MNYARPELRDLLAGKYVLGHLRGGARRRFERLLPTQPALAQAVADWEERLAPLAQGAPAIAPPPRVWRRIRRRTGAAPARPRFALAAFAAAATAAFFVMLGLYLARPPAPPAASRVAVIASRQGAPRWVISVRGARMHMRAVGSEPPPQGKSYQLWMLPGGGAKPVSLGLLPASGAASERLPAPLLRTLRKAATLAVSVEPAGGSPTGQPTGPVVFTAALVAT